MPAPPTAREFVRVLQTSSDGLDADQNSAIFGGVFDDEPIEGKARSTGVSKSSVKALLEFIRILEKTGGMPTSLDNLLCDFGRFVLEPQVLSGIPAKHQEIPEHRRKMCIEHNIPFRKLCTGTFRTYINSMGKVFNKGGGMPKVVMSSETQFPKFDTFTRQCSTRHMDHEAAAKANKPAKSSVLNDHDLEK